MNKLEKDRERKLQQEIKNAMKIVKLQAQQRKSNEDQLHEKLGIQQAIYEFQKPVTDKLVQQSERATENFKAISSALDTLNTPLYDNLNTSLPQIEYEDYSFDELFKEKTSTAVQTMKEIQTFNFDKSLDQHLIQSKGFKMPNQLAHENEETLYKIIEEASKIKDKAAVDKRTSESAIARSSKEDIKENHKILLKLNNHVFKHFKKYIEALEYIITVKEKYGKGLDLLDVLSEMTDKICKGSKCKKLYNQIVYLLDVLLKNGTFTNEQVKQYYQQFLL